MFQGCLRVIGNTARASIAALTQNLGVSYGGPPNWIWCSTTSSQGLKQRYTMGVSLVDTQSGSFPCGVPFTPARPPPPPQNAAHTHRHGTLKRERPPCRMILAVSGAAWRFRWVSVQCRNMGLGACQLGCFFELASADLCRRSTSWAVSIALRWPSTLATLWAAELSFQRRSERCNVPAKANHRGSSGD